MPYIGAVACDSVRGSIAPMRMNVLTYSVPGIDGIGAHLVGNRAGKADLTADLYDSHANVLAWFAAIEALNGQVVTVITDQTTNYLCLLLDVVRVAEPMPAWPYPYHGQMKILVERVG